MMQIAMRIERMPVKMLVVMLRSDEDVGRTAIIPGDEDGEDASDVGNDREGERRCW